MLPPAVPGPWSWWPQRPLGFILSRTGRSLGNILHDTRVRAALVRLYVTLWWIKLFPPLFKLIKIGKFKSTNSGIKSWTWLDLGKDAKAPGHFAESLELGVVLYLSKQYLCAVWGSCKTGEGLESVRSCLDTVSFTTAAYDKASPKPHAWAEAGLNSYITGAAAPKNRLVEVGSAPVFFMALPALCCRQEPFPVLPTSPHCADFFIPLLFLRRFPPIAGHMPQLTCDSESGCFENCSI